MKANRFMSQLLDYCPGNTPKVSNWSRSSPLSGLMTNTFGVFVSILHRVVGPVGVPRIRPRFSGRRLTELQGYLAHKKPPPL